MTTSPHVSSTSAVDPAELLRDLASAVKLTSICVPAQMRRASPQLVSAASTLGLRATRRPAGDEDLLCALAEPQVQDTVDRLQKALAKFKEPPFLLLLVTEPQSLLAVVAMLLSPPYRWLLRTDRAGPEAVLLVSEELMLAMPALPGEWRAAPVAGDAVRSEHDALAALWPTAEHDRAALAAVAELIDDHQRQLADARNTGEKLSAEVARLRSSERRELDRMRLELLEERAWVAEQARRIAQSSSWRIGHRIVRIARRLAFKHDRGTNLPARIAERMEEDELR